MSKSLEPKRTALGKRNEIVVVADQDLWESEVRDSFSYYFESAYPIMPAPEPIFDIRHFTLDELEDEPLRKELRTYIVLSDLSDLDSRVTKMVRKDIRPERIDQAMKDGTITSSVGQNKWARGQLVMYLYGKDRKTLASSIAKNYGAAAKKVINHDYKQLDQRVYARELNLGLQAKLNDYYGIDLKVPADFRQALHEEVDNIYWLRKDTKDAIMNLVFFKTPYKDKQQFTKANMIEMINAYGHNYVDSNNQDDSLVVNEEDLPIYEYTTTIDGMQSKELRGLWEMTKSFTGGPFVANMFTSKDGKDLLMVYAYVYAPGVEKRDLVQELEHMIENIKLGDGGKE